MPYLTTFGISYIGSIYAFEITCENKYKTKMTL